MLYIKAAMAEAEVEKISVRARRKHQQEAEQGKRNHGVIRPMGEVWHGKQKVSQERAAHERELIREAVRRLIAGDTLRGIAVDWTDRGERTPAGGKWYNVNIRRMLLSPRLIGMRLHNGQLYPGTWEPILTVEEYEAVKAILEDPARYKYERGGLPKHLLSGIAFCGLCSNKLSVRKRYDNRIYYCSQNPPAGGCGKIQRVVDQLEGLITEAIFVAVESDTRRKVGEGTEDPVAPLYDQLAALQGLYDCLETKRADELIGKETYKRKRTQYERSMEDVRREIARVRGGQVIGLAPRNLRDVWPNLSLDRRRNIIKAVLTRVIVNPQPNSVVFDPNAIVADWRVDTGIAVLPRVAIWREMDTAHGEQDWVETNAQRAGEALSRPEVQAELYRLLGGEPDPEAVRQTLVREVARLRLNWRPGR